jgi:formyltetrahydrofolate deformylase
VSRPSRHHRALSNCLAETGANTVTSAQHSTDPENGSFFLRMAFHLPMLETRRWEIEDRLARIGDRFDMRWRLASAAEKKRVAFLVSRHEHCLLDLLWRWQRKELDIDIVAVISKHADLEQEVTNFGVPYHHVPVTSKIKSQAEASMLDLLAGKIDLVVLARYMQILSADFLQQIAAPVINIHHSFLPAFIGANPYAQAHQRGVKLIGATAHYATEDLDEGPIIEHGVK